MWKPMLVGTVALALSGSGLVLAQQRPAPATPQTTPSAPAQTAPSSSPPSTPPAPSSPSAQAAPTSPSVPKATPQKPGASQEPSAEEREAAARREDEAEEQAELAGRLASLKAGLMLTDEQAKNWPDFEKAYREFAQVRTEQWRKFRDGQRSDNPLENMEARAEFAVSRGTAMKEFVEAAMPLYESLDSGQKRRFRNVALRGLRMGMMARHHGYGRDGYGPRWRDRDDDRGGDGKRWGDRDGYGKRWRDRDDDERGYYGRRWGGRGSDDDGCGRYGSYHRWHQRGEGMMGPRSNWRDRDNDDQRGGSSDDQSNRDSDSDDGNGSGSNRSGSSRLSPDEERF
ncbi:MAG: Spy/CpxP family protein refolding chaperone [Xanthobacteraceae bacterium]